MLDDFVDDYLATALWSSMCSLPCSEDELVDGCMDVDKDHPLHNVSEHYPCDAYFGIEDFTDEAVAKARADCSEFLNRAGAIDFSKENESYGLISLLGRAIEYGSASHVAHDFWLTRNGHGAGFWDGDYRDDYDEKDSVGEQLTELVDKHFNECYVYINEDGSLGLEG